MELDDHLLADVDDKISEEPTVNLVGGADEISNSTWSHHELHGFLANVTYFSEPALQLSDMNNLLESESDIREKSEDLYNHTEYDYNSIETKFNNRPHYFLPNENDCTISEISDKNNLVNQDDCCDYESNISVLKVEYKNNELRFKIFNKNSFTLENLNFHQLDCILIDDKLLFTDTSKIDHSLSFTDNSNDCKS